MTSLDDRFDKLVYKHAGNGTANSSYFIKETREFLHEELARRDQEWKEKIEAKKIEYERKYLKPWPNNDYGNGRIDAPSDLLEDKT